MRLLIVSSLIAAHLAIWPLTPSCVEAAEDAHDYHELKKELRADGTVKLLIATQTRADGIKTRLTTWEDNGDIVISDWLAGLPIARSSSNDGLIRVTTNWSAPKRGIKPTVDFEKHIPEEVFQEKEVVETRVSSLVRTRLRRNKNGTFGVVNKTTDAHPTVE